MPSMVAMGAAGLVRGALTRYLERGGWLFGGGALLGEDGVHGVSWAPASGGDAAAAHGVCARRIAAGVLQRGATTRTVQFASNRSSASGSLHRCPSIN